MKTRFRGHHPDDFIRHPDRGVTPDDIDGGAASAEQHRMFDSHRPESHLLQGDEGPINDNGLFLSDEGAIVAEQHRVLDSHNPESHLLQGDEGPINDHGLPLGGKER